MHFAITRITQHCPSGQSYKNHLFSKPTILIRNQQKISNYLNPVSRKTKQRGTKWKFSESAICSITTVTDHINWFQFGNTFVMEFSCWGSMKSIFLHNLFIHLLNIQINRNKVKKWKSRVLIFVRIRAEKKIFKKIT